MKRLLFFVSMAVVLSLALGACNIPLRAAAGADATESPADNPAATEQPIAATIAPVDLAGPPMKVGSFYTYVDGSILAAVPGGPFTMGYNNFVDSKEHEVTLSDYWIYTNEVTNQQFALCVAAGKCAPPDPTNNPVFDDYRFVNFPVVGVRYQDAADYCDLVHGRLPTEAEWEKAARGPDANLFPWGNGAPKCDLLNHNFCTGKTLKVESYPKGVSYYGLFDMAGNVSEWVADWYQPQYDTSLSTDPLGPAIGQKRSVRSSGFEDGGDSAFAAHRSSFKPTGHRKDLGFRCVVDDPTFFAPYCQGMVLYGADINGAPNVPVVPVADDCIQSNLSTTIDGCGTGTSHLIISPWLLPAGATLSIDPAAACNGDRPVATCTGTGSATVFAETCLPAPPPSVDPSCAPGYVSSPDPADSSKIICKGQGPGVNCPDGFALDPLLNCCSAVNPGPHEYGFCIGFDQATSTDCYNNPDPPVQPHDVSVAIAPPAACGDGPCVDDPGTSVNECAPCTGSNCGPPPSCGTYPACGPNCHPNQQLVCVPN